MPVDRLREVEKRYEEMMARYEANEFGAWTSLESVMFDNPLGGITGTVGTIAALFGDKEAQNHEISKLIKNINDIVGEDSLKMGIGKNKK